LTEWIVLYYYIIFSYIYIYISSRVE
jgi:hypothetical protein